MSIATVYERQMLDLINADRAAHGLAPVQLELRLNASSDIHSSWMNASDVFSHTGAGGSSATQRMKDAGFDFSGRWASGENLAWQSERGADGISDDVADLHIALMNSPGHRANILSPKFELVGIGIVEGVFRGMDGVMITQNFARTDAEVFLDPGIAPHPAEPPVAEPPAQIAAPAVPEPPPGPNVAAPAAPAAPPAVAAPATAGPINGLEYIASYGDLIAAFGANADAGRAHYEGHGRAEGRTVTFDGLEYIASYDDLIAAFGANDTAGAAHFINNGRHEGRSVTFDALEYIASHDDLIVAFGANADAGAAHFIAEGIHQGRTRDAFDAQQYVENYADLSAAFGTDLEAATLHYIQAGFFEGRTDDFLFL
jgi:hypothetical protein